MTNKVILILASVIGPTLFAQQQISLGEIEKLLGSDDFKVRRDTMEVLWKEGKISIETLDQLGESKDPEISVRALSLRRKLALGLSPDTPQEILDLLDDYFTQSANGKVLLFNRLKKMQEFRLMLRLKNVETDEEVLERLDEIVTEVLPNVQMSLLISGDLKEAKELLLLNQDYRSLIAYANLCDYLGELDLEIGRLRDMDDDKSRARYLACLRVKGDATILRAEAERLGDEDATMVAALAEGDLVPLFEHLREEGDLSRMDRSYLSWIMAEWAGDQDLMEKYYSRLKHHVQDSPEAYQAKRNLLKMGLGEEVLKGYSNELINELRFDYLVGQDRNIEVLKLLGLEEAVVTEEWLAQVYGRTVKRFNNHDEGRPEAEFFMAAGFFESIGMVEGAARCLEKFLDAVRGAEEENVLSWAPDVYLAANRAGLVALAREVTDFELDTSSVLSLIRPKIHPFYEYKVDEEGLEWLMVRLLDEEDDRSALEVMQLAVSFYKEPLVAVELFEEVEKKFRDEALAGQDPEVGLNHLFNCAKARNQGEDIFLYMRLLEENGEDVSNSESYYLSLCEEYAKAAELYEESGALETATNPPYLYRAGLVLQKAGVPDGETHLKRARLFSQGRVNYLANFANMHLSLGDVEGARELYHQALLRIERIDVNEAVELGPLIEGGASAALQARDWRRAQALYELQSWLLKTPFSDFQVIRARFRILFTRGMLAAEEGRREDAIRDLRAAHSLIPRSGVLADDFFPALREANLIELHNELFEVSAGYIRESIRFFPMDHNMKNTFGWLASRANRALDEAQGYLEEALKVRPLSAAYLDTMGEIYFAKGDREKAVEWSDRSLGQMLTDAQLRQQNRRFREGPFPVK